MFDVRMQHAMEGMKQYLRYYCEWRIRNYVVREDVVAIHKNRRSSRGPRVKGKLTIISTKLPSQMASVDYFFGWHSRV